MDESISAQNIEEQVLTVLAQIRPALQIDGGDVQLIAIDNSYKCDVKLYLTGPYIDGLSTTTLIRMGIERKLREQIPTLGKVIAINTFDS